MNKYKLHIRRLNGHLLSCRKHGFNSQIPFDVDGKPCVPDCLYNYIKSVEPPVRIYKTGGREVQVAELNESELESGINLLEIFLADDVAEKEKLKKLKRGKQNENTP